MSVCLGNLTTKEVFDRLGVELSEDIHESLDILRTDEADVPEGKWHGFDIPFQIICGDIETAKILVNILAPIADKFTTELKIAYK